MAERPFVVSARGCPATVEVILVDKANVNLGNHDGYTPLDTALLRRSRETVAPLIANGADIGARDIGGPARRRRPTVDPW